MDRELVLAVGRASMAAQRLGASMHRGLFKLLRLRFCPDCGNRMIREPAMLRCPHCGLSMSDSDEPTAEFKPTETTDDQP